MTSVLVDREAGEPVGLAIPVEAAGRRRDGVVRTEERDPPMTQLDEVLDRQGGAAPVILEEDVPVDPGRLAVEEDDRRVLQPGLQVGLVGRDGSDQQTVDLAAQQCLDHRAVPARDRCPDS